MIDRDDLQLKLIAARARIEESIDNRGDAFLNFRRVVALESVGIRVQDRQRIAVPGFPAARVLHDPTDKGSFRMVCGVDTDRVGPNIVFMPGLTCCVGEKSVLPDAALDIVLRRRGWGRGGI